MTDKRLYDYLFEKGYLIDFTKGALSMVPKRACPFLINGKCPAGDVVIDGERFYDGMTLEEFQEWESTRSCG